MVAALGIGVGMVRYTLRVFGFPVLSLDTHHYEYVGEEESGEIAGGSWHDFERDTSPVTPEDRYNWEWEDKAQFGFGGARA